MERSADESFVKRIGRELPVLLLALVSYAIAAAMLVNLGFAFNSTLWSLFVWLVLYPAFNGAAGYMLCRRWAVAIPLFGSLVLILEYTMFGFLGWEGIVNGIALLALGSISVAAGVALRLHRRGDLRGHARPLIAMAIAGVAFIGVAGLLEIFAAGDPSCAHFKLSPVAGKAGDRLRYDGRTQRVFMADNAVRCGLLVGMSGDEVKAVFGGGETIGGRGTATLDLGSASTGFGDEIHYLDLDFDRRTGRVSHATREDGTD